LFFSLITLTAATGQVSIDTVWVVWGWLQTSETIKDGTVFKSSFKHRFLTPISKKIITTYQNANNPILDDVPFLLQLFPKSPSS